MNGIRAAGAAKIAGIRHLSFMNGYSLRLITVASITLMVLFVPSIARAVDGEITYTGTNTGLIGDDVSAGPFNIGFTFPFYGTNYTQVYANINGTITFGTGYSAYSNGALASSGANNTVYAFWDDLNTQSTRNIYYATVGTAPNRMFVMQWTNIYFHGTTVQMGTFQAILYEGSNAIQIQYRDLLGGDRALGNSATIGIKKDNATLKQYSNNTASLTQGQAIRYTPNGSNDYTQNANGTYELVYLAPEGAPTSPTLVNPTDGTSGVTLTPTFEWLPVASATSYTVLISTVSNFSSTVVNQSGITATSYTPGSNLNAGTNYYWRVQAVNASGSSLSPTRSFTTGSANAAPSTPSSVTSAALAGGVESASLSGATLTATLADPDDAEQVRYRLQIATDSNFSSLVIDYRSPFGDEGDVTYTYGEEGGTYLVGTATTTLPVDDYYLRIRTEDDAAASSAWHTVSGVAFSVVDAPDTTPPTLSSISVAALATSTATITWSTNEAADSSVSYGTSASYGNASSSSALVTSHQIMLSGLTPGTTYHYRVQSADSASNAATSSDLTFTTDALPDDTAPGISGISVSPESNEATILWSTDELASSIVEYGPSTSYTASTTEQNTTPRVLSHEVTLTGLESCVTYHYRVRSLDASGNEVVGNDNRFTTKGCTGAALVTAQNASSVSTSTGGTVELVSAGRGIGITVPASFSTTSAHFQIKKVDNSAVLATTQVPTGKEGVGIYTYELHAVTDDFILIEEFDEPITLTVSYGEDDVEGIIEPTLKIYRWHAGEWSALPDCSVDVSLKTVTCSTDHFSTFGLFGEPEPVTEVSSTRSGSSRRTGTSIQTRVRNLVSVGNTEAAETLKSEWPTLFEETPSTSTSTTTSTLLSVRDLEFRMEGDDVRMLQELLIAQVKGPDAANLARVGATGYFGSYTQRALSEYQRASSVFPASGYFGPLTRAQMKESGVVGIWW